jgi:hypothetical protein
MKTIRNVGICTALLWVLLPATTALAAGLPHTFSAGAPANAGDVNDNFRYVAPKNVINVSPVDGGTTMDNGAALLDALDPASIAAINGAANSSNPYLVHLAPGIYDLDGASAVLPAFVYLEGSGKGATWVNSNVNLSIGGTITLANNSVVRHLSVQNYYGAGSGVAVYATGVDSKIEDIEAVVSGTGIKAGVFLDNNAELDIDDVFVHGVPTSGSWYGISLDSSSTVHANNLNIEADGSATEMAGADILNATAELRNTRIVTKNTYGSGKVYGVRVIGSAASVAAIQDGKIHVTGMSADQYPFWVNGPSASLTVQHSEVLSGSGSSGSEYFLYINKGSAKFATSRLAPDIYASTGAGSITCAYIYDTNYAEVASCTEAPF